MQSNIKNNYDLSTSISEISKFVQVDSPVFLVIDDYISYNATQELINKLNIKYIIIEGHRFRQRKSVGKILLKFPNYTKFYGNSFNSVKGAVVFKIVPRPYKFLSLLSYIRLNIQSNLFARKILQFCGIRKKFLLNKYYKS